MSAPRKSLPRLNAYGSMREIFLPLCGDSRTARLRALEFYAPMHLLYSMYDGAAEKCAVLPLLEDYIDGFCSRFSAP